MKNTKKIIFITGASSGIGRETAKLMAEKGHKVFAGVRRKADKESLEKLSKNIIPVYIDVTNFSSIDKAFWYIIKNTDKLDVLINNAGIAIGGPLEFLPIKAVKEQFDVNTFGALAVAQKFIPFLKNGKIINISSMASSGLFPFIAPYCASKSALDILFNCLMLENKDNIKVVSIKPASIKTPIWRKSLNLAKSNLENLNETAKEKYQKELLYLEKNILENSDKGINIKYVADKIIKIINEENPKPSYSVGLKSMLVQIIARFPLSITNFVIKNLIKKS